MPRIYSGPARRRQKRDPVENPHLQNLSLMEPTVERPEDHVAKAVALPELRFGAGEVSRSSRRLVLKGQCHEMEIFLKVYTF